MATVVRGVAADPFAATIAALQVEGRAFVN
jgi:hypothetical protein